MGTIERLGWVWMVILCAAACGAPAMVPARTPGAPLPESERYAAALASALDAYEADLKAAASRWYASHAEAYAVSQRFTEPDVTRLVSRAFAAHRIDAAEVERFARSHPEFVREQNALFHERMSALRPMAFSVMGRIDARRAMPEEPVRATTRLAATSEPEPIALGGR